MLHRIKKKKDVNKGKWIGVGGKLEAGESPLECIMREVKEETGYQLHQAVCHGFVTFPGLLFGEDEGMFIYTSQDFSGEMVECNEGVLEWIENNQIQPLPMWEGDHYFFDWIKDDLFHIAKITYKEDKLVEFVDETNK